MGINFLLILYTGFSQTELGPHEKGSLFNLEDDFVFFQQISMLARNFVPVVATLLYNLFAQGAGLWQSHKEEMSRSGMK